MGHQFVPVLTAAGRQQAFIISDAKNGTTHHDTLEIAGQQQIAASTYYYIRCIG